MQFKHGDRVRCIDDGPAKPALKKGTIYIVQACDGTSVQLLDNGCWYWASRFELADAEPETTVDWHFVEVPSTGERKRGHKNYRTKQEVLDTLHKYGSKDCTYEIVKFVQREVVESTLKYELPTEGTWIEEKA